MQMRKASLEAPCWAIRDCGDANFGKKIWVNPFETRSVRDLPFQSFQKDPAVRSCPVVDGNEVCFA